MIIRYNGKRMWRCWQSGKNEWTGVEPEYSVSRKEVVNRNKLIAKSKEELVDRIESVCKFDELVANGMDRMEAANVAMFG
jgi:hypothetical protein